MSQKKAKAKRREEREAQKADNPKPIGQITIDVYPDLNVNVSNFPSDHNIAMMVLCNALLKVSAYFMEQQSANNKSNILLARPGASRADIIKMAAGN